MELCKRNCGIGMKLVACDDGWLEVELSIEGDEHHFAISDVSEDQFDDLLRILYRLYPDHVGDRNDMRGIECVVALDQYIDGKYRTVRIVDSPRDCPGGGVFHDVPRKAYFTWDGEDDGSAWELERDPTEEPDFTLRISIVHGGKRFRYSVRYADLCYAVAKACTDALKRYGFTGLYQATGSRSIDIAQLLFLKGIALGALDACECTYCGENGEGESSDLSKELELLLFDI